MIEIFAGEDHQTGGEADEGGGGGAENHFSDLDMPAVIHALSELLQDDPGVTHVLGEDIRVEADEVFGEVDDEDRADADGDGGAGSANESGDQETVTDERAER